jgi:hypothetical protein
MKIIRVEFGSGVLGRATDELFFSVPSDVDLEQLKEIMAKEVKERGVEENQGIMVTRIAGFPTHIEVIRWVKQILRGYGLEELADFPTLRVQYENYNSQGQPSCSLT